MPLKKTIIKSTTATEEDFFPGFDRARLDRLAASMQPLLTRNATDEELEALLMEAEDCLQEVATDTGKSEKARRFQGWWTRSAKGAKRVKTVEVMGVEGV